jgi:conjugative relaxase-like TrwC/TraI family protein
VLGIHRVGAGRADYYLSDLAAELPETAPGRWAGLGADGLGLRGPLAAADFREVLLGRHPVTGRAMRPGRATVAAYDVTVSAPKSVSVLFGLGGEDVARGVLAAHAQAVDGALRYLEQHALSAVRHAGPVRSVVQVSGAVAGVFTHGVSRSVDPHVHSHVVLANLAHGSDGRWSSTDQRALFAHRRAASAVYGAHLRAALADGLGVRWAAVGADGLEVAGVTPELRSVFSARSADIRRRRHEAGAHSRRGRHVAWAATRPPKGQDLDAAALRELWARRAQNSGAGPLVLGEVLGRPDARPPLDEHRYGAAIMLTAHGGAHRRDVVAAFGAAAPGGMDEGAFTHATAAWVPAQPPQAVGVAEPLHRRRDVVPANHLVRALGPRPTTRGAHELWLDTAKVIDAYRARWGLHATREPEPLGAGDRAALTAMPPARLADHLRTARRLDETRARLGLRRPAAVELGLTR